MSPEQRLPSAVFDSIQAGIEGDATKARASTELLLQRFLKEGREPDVESLQRLLAGEKGQIFLPAKELQ